MKKLLFVISAVLFLSTAVNAEGPYKASDYVSDFSLKNVRGEMISLSQFETAKGFIVIFSCNTCPVVVKYEDRMKDLHREFSSKGYPVIAINSNDKAISPGDSYDEMQKTAKAKSYPFHYLYDESQEIVKRFGATNTPHVYLLSKEGGRLKVGYIGAIDNNADDASKADKKYVADAINKLLKGEQIAVSGTKAVGCSIKWKKV